MNKQKIIVCSMYRSGGTLLFNILKEIVEKNKLSFIVQKRHTNWTNTEKKWVGPGGYEGNELLFYSYRDVDDVIFSYCKREKITDEEGFKKLTNNSKEGFKKWITDQDKLVSPHAICFSYEREINNREIELQNKLEKLFNVPISNKTNFLRSEVKKFTDSLERVDIKTGFWPNHVS